MTAADHLAAAESALTEAERLGRDGLAEDGTRHLVRGILHGLCAVAIELGVPPVQQQAGGQES